MPKTQRPQQERQPSKERKFWKENKTTIKLRNNNSLIKKKKKKKKKTLRVIKQTTVHPYSINGIFILKIISKYLPVG